jgi:ribosomal protein S18 acetylase RimI-like enzyme
VQTDLKELKIRLIQDANLDIQLIFVSPSPVPSTPTFKIISSAMLTYLYNREDFFEFLERYKLDIGDLPKSDSGLERYMDELKVENDCIILKMYGIEYFELEYMLDMIYSNEALSKQIQNKEQLFYLISDSESIIGFIGIEHNYKSEAITKIHKIYLLPETQGKGYGKIVFEEIAKMALENNSKELLLNVNRFNTALNFYKKLGFEIKETVDIEIGNGYLMEDYVMQLEVKH